MKHVKAAGSVIGLVLLMSATEAMKVMAAEPSSGCRSKLFELAQTTSLTAERIGDEFFKADKITSNAKGKQLLAQVIAPPPAPVRPVLPYPLSPTISPLSTPKGLLCEGPDLKIPDSAPTKAVVRAYSFTTGLSDNGNYSTDGDAVRLDVWKDQLVNIFPADRQIFWGLSPSEATGTFNLPAVKNKICIVGLAVGDVPPATTGYIVKQIEEKDVPLGSQQQVALTDKTFSANLGIGGSTCFPMECRRKPATGSGDSDKLARNLEAQTGPGKLTWYKERMPCSTEAHHIVASGARYKYADLSRKIIASCGINVNDSINGVPLPDAPGVPVEGYVHKKNVNAYYDAVYADLTAAEQVDKAQGAFGSGQCPSIKAKLQEIRQKLQDQNYTAW
jgi:hypothetical protein